MTGAVLGRLAWCLLAVSGAMAVVGLTLARSAAADGVGQPFGAQVTSVLGWLTYAAIGALIANRRPRNAIGWIFCGIGLTFQVQAVALGYIEYAVRPATAPLLAPGQVAWLINMWVVAFGLVPLLLLLFPNGHLLSPRWGFVVWVLAVYTVLGLLTSDLLVGPIHSQPPLVNDLFGVDRGGAISHAAQNVVGVLMLALFVFGAVGMFVRLRHARGDERQQLKWFAYAALVLAVDLVVLAVIFFSPLRLVVDPVATLPPDLFDGIPFAVGLVGVPAAAAVAILRYRLYDIDFLINRTLVYGALSALLALAYWVCVALLQQALRPLTQGSELAIVASTLAVAALFNPLRRRIQHIVDRRFYRRTYDAARTLETFSARLRDEVDLDSLRIELLTVVQRTMLPASASLWLRPPSRR